MFSARIFWKLLACFVGLIVLAAGVVGVIANQTLMGAETTNLERSLRSSGALLAELARPALETGDASSLTAVMRRLGAATQQRLTVIDAEGKVLADSQGDPRTMDDHSNRPEVVEAKRVGVGVASRGSATVHASLMYVAIRIDRDGRVLGYARASRSLRKLDERLSALRRKLLLAGAVAALLSVTLAFVLARRFASPLRAMTVAATAVAHGDYARRVSAPSRDELGRLADAFNRMSVQLSDRISTITQDRARLRTILAGMVEGVVATDAEDRILVMNEAAGRILGTDPAAAIGRPVWEVTRVPEVADALSSASREGALQEREARLVETPMDRVLKLHAAPLDQGGDPAGGVLVLHDITELRHLEQVRRDFVANVSHELKTPLAAVRGITETILEDPDMPTDTRRSFLERVHRQVLRLTEMVEELLELSRLEAEPRDVPAELVDARLGIGEALEAVRPVAVERGHGLTAKLPDVPVWVHGSDEALQRIVGNLLDNAMKYTPEGGLVEVVLSQGPKGAELVVQDDGPGIPVEARERIFERFFRVDAGRARTAGGTGLGLSIVKHLAESLGAMVWVAGRSQGGSTFHVRFPAPRRDDTESPAQDAASAGRAS